MAGGHPVPTGRLAHTNRSTADGVRDRGTILEHAPDFSSPADLVRKAGRARPEATLQQYTPTERAFAETKQNEWSHSVAQLRGEDYIPEASDDEEREVKDWDPDWEDVTMLCVVSGFSRIEIESRALRALGPSGRFLYGTSINCKPSARYIPGRTVNY